MDGLKIEEYLTGGAHAAETAVLYNNLGLDPAILHAESVARLLTPAQRKREGVQTAAEAQDSAVAKSERELQNMIVAMLRRNGIWVIQQRMDKRSNVAEGTPDILFVVRGIAVAMECKMPGKKPTKQQDEAMHIMETNGWRCFVITDYADALATFLSL